MTKRLLIAVFAVGLMAPLPGTSAASPAAAAQERTSPAPTPPPPPPAPPAQPARPAPPAPPQPPQPSSAQSTANVQLDVVITDTVSGKPETKTVTLSLRAGRAGSIRTEGEVYTRAGLGFGVELALDGSVAVVGPELLEARVTFTYAAPPQDSAASTPEATSARISAPAKVTQNLATVLRSGRPMLVSRSADPVTNRTVTVELTATIREP